MKDAGRDEQVRVSDRRVLEDHVGARASLHLTRRSDFRKDTGQV